MDPQTKLAIISGVFLLLATWISTLYIVKQYKTKKHLDRTADMIETLVSYVTYIRSLIDFDGLNKILPERCEQLIEKSAKLVNSGEVYLIYEKNKKTAESLVNIMQGSTTLLMYLKDRRVKNNMICFQGTERVTMNIMIVDLHNEFEEFQKLIGKTGKRNIIKR